MDSDLWTKVLDENNQFRRQLIDQASCSEGLQCSFMLTVEVIWQACLLHEIVSVTTSLTATPVPCKGLLSRPGGETKLSCLLPVLVPCPLPSASELQVAVRK